MEERIQQLCDRAVNSGVFPGCSVGFVTPGQTGVVAAGRLTYEPDSPEVTANSHYDVASVTKSVPTGCLALKLIEDGRLGLDDRIVEYIPELEMDMAEEIMVRHLLTYTVVFDLPGGLGALAQRHPDVMLEELFSTPLLAEPGSTYAYTNAPAVLLGLIVERLHKAPLDEVADKELFRPLGMTQTGFDGRRFKPGTVAPTEVGPDGEICGVVHDESARAMAGQGRRSGAAGLFSTAGDLLNFAQMLLSGGEIDEVKLFDPGTVELMHRNHILHLGKQAGLGWELNQPEFMGSKTSDQAFGKTGFTGCVMIIDPVKQAAMVHLSNRTYPKRPAKRDGINRVRRELAEIIFSA